MLPSPCTFETFINKHTLQKHGIEQGVFVVASHGNKVPYPQVVVLNAHKAMAKAEVGILAKRMFNEVGILVERAKRMVQCPSS